MSKWSEGAEGFICPYCLVSFASSNKLQAHFIDFHSNEGEDTPEPSVEEVVVEDKLGHYWQSSSLAKPTSCQVCSDIIWSSSYTCNVCHMVIHADKCVDQVTKVCEDSPDKANHTSDPVRADAPPPVKAIHELPNVVKRQVAKGRNRYVDEQFDLDLSYITDRVIAMSFPGSGVEVAYRNSLKDVAAMLKTRHDENYMIFNLSERSYDISKFNNQVLDFGWPDHLAPSLERLSIVCKSMKSWLDSDPQHVVVVHCKGGKGRTGCVIAAFMHYSQICESAQAALDHFAMKRFYDKKLQGVTQPSQKLYVHYFANLLNGKMTLDKPPLKLTCIMIHGIPNFDGKGGCRPFIKIYQNMQLIHTSGLYVCTSDKDRIKVSLYGGLKLEGEVLVKCFHKRIHSGVDSIFRCQFHHSVIEDYRYVLGKAELDDAFKDKRFPDHVKVEMIFESWNEGKSKLPDATDGLEITDSTDLRHSLLADRVRDSMAFDDATDSGDRRNSYFDFNGGFDHGVPSDEMPNLIQFDTEATNKEDDNRKRSSSHNMDPSLIERVETDNGDLYTVVSKVTPNSSPQPNRKIESSGSHKYSHLVHNNRPIHQQPPKQPKQPKQPLLPKDQYSIIKRPGGSPVLNRKHQPRPSSPKPTKPGSISPKPPVKPSPKPDTSPKPSTGPTKRCNYDHIEGKQAVLTPIPPRESAVDNDMWMKLKWETLQDSPINRRSRESSLNRSTSQSALDIDYSSIPEVIITQQRRYSEGDNTLLITSPTPPDSTVFSNDEVIYTDPSQSNEDIYTVPPDEDYVNFDAEENSHVYSNEAELKEHWKEMYEPSVEEIRPATVIQQKLPSSSIKDKILMNLKLIPSSKTVIQSPSMTEEERKESLGMFQLNAQQGLRVGRGDYTLFNKDSWGPSRTEQPSSRTPPPKPSPPSKPANAQPKQSNLSSSKQQPPRYSPPQPSRPLPSLPTSSNSFRSLSPPTNNKPPTPNKPKETHQNGPTTKPKPPVPPQPSVAALKSAHRPLQTSKSQPTVDKPDQKSSVPSASHITSKGTKPIPPSKPAPYRSDAGSISVSQVKDLMPLWYKPSISRDEACCLVKSMDAGSFIVRDSQTVNGGYALTIKVSKELVRQRKKISEDTEVTDDMCVTHFLIQPDPVGVKLQGWNEPAFKTLPDFIARHTFEKLCLPCVLKLPKSGSAAPHARKMATLQQSLISGAACDLIYLGSMEVSYPTSDAISQAVQQMKDLDLVSFSIINFKASKSGITITDSSTGLLSKRNYPLNMIKHCGLDPNDTRWDVPNISTSPLKNKPCFGIIHQLQDSPGYACLLFAELDESQPVSHIVNYLKHLFSLP